VITEDTRELARILHEEHIHMRRAPRYYQPHAGVPTLDQIDLWCEPEPLVGYAHLAALIHWEAE